MKEKQLQIFKTVIKDLLTYEHVIEMDQYMQHGDITTLQHSMLVAYYSYAFNCKLHLHSDEKSLIKGAFLHDYYLYDWHEDQVWHKWHGFRHAKFAWENAKRDFYLTEKEEEIIRKHMWPLTLIPPRCREAWLVNAIDTLSSVIEVMMEYRPFYGLKDRWTIRPLQILGEYYD